MRVSRCENIFQFTSKLQGVCLITLQYCVSHRLETATQRVTKEGEAFTNDRNYNVAANQGCNTKGLTGGTKLGEIWEWKTGH